DRHSLIVPAGGSLDDPPNHLVRGQLRPGGELARRVLAGGQELHVSSPDVDDKDVHHALRRCQPALLSAALLDTMTASNSCQDWTKERAPSSWSRAARARTSVPAWVNRASTSSQSPPCAGRIGPTSPWSASALSVPSGMVLTVNGAARDLT